MVVVRGGTSAEVAADVGGRSTEGVLTLNLTKAEEKKRMKGCCVKSYAWKEKQSAGNKKFQSNQPLQKDNPTLDLRRYHRTFKLGFVPNFFFKMVLCGHACGRACAVTFHPYPNVTWLFSRSSCFSESETQSCSAVKSLHTPVSTCP